jgi:hypothetical protein
MPVYVDCADRLEREAGEAGRLDLSVARSLVLEVVAAHSDFAWSEEDAAADIRVRAGRVFNHLLDARWLEDRPESLHERWVLISPALRPLLIMFRELATETVGELAYFADTLDGICRTLEAEDVLDAGKQTADALRSTVSDLNQRLATAIAQLHSVEKVVYGFEQRQMQTRTGAETLQLLYGGDFYEGHHMVCHEVLHRRGLMSRLHAARDTVREAAGDPLVVERLGEGLRGAGNVAPENAWQLAESELARLLKGLAGIRQRADAVDARIASFHQLSRQRLFYQTEMRGRRPEMARRLCETINERFAGLRFADLSGPKLSEITAPWRGILTTEVDVFYGTASLRIPRRASQPVSLELADAKIDPPDEAEFARLRELVRVALTPDRAARLVGRLLPEVGNNLGTKAMTVTSEEVLLDLIAAASFDHALSMEGVMRWEAALDHEEEAIERGDVPRDPLYEWNVERFTLTRTA